MTGDQTQKEALTTDERCLCEEPEPALMDHGLSSLCEKCYRVIAPPSAKEPGSETPGHQAGCYYSETQPCKCGLVTERPKPVRGYLGSTPWGDIDDGP